MGQFESMTWMQHGKWISGAVPRLTRLFIPPFEMTCNQSPDSETDSDNLVDDGTLYLDGYSLLG
jgi:hypothetical protein